MSSGPIISQQQANILESAIAGAFLSMLLQPKVGWRQALTIFSAGILCAFFLAKPLAYLFSHWTGADPIACLPVSGFAVGFVGMYFCSAALVLLRNFSTDPFAVLTKVRRLWSGQNDDHPSA